MDILTRFSRFIWDDLLGDMPAELAMFFMRWGLLLFFLIAFGAFVRFVLAPRLTGTLHVQVIAAIVAIYLGLAIPLDDLADARDPGCRFVLLVSLVVFAFAPWFAPGVLIRRRGVQKIVRTITYVAEFILLGVQILVL